MFEIGSSLREARTRRGLSPTDVHTAIRIRERYLTALEEERWAMLPGDAYTKGFLRTYADFLGLDGQLYVDEYNERIAVRDEETVAAEPPRRRSLPLRAIGAAVVVAAALGAVTAWRLGGDHPQAGAGAPTPHIVHHTKEHVSKPVVAPKPTFTLVRAARDRSWLLIRIGGPNGRTIYQDTLEQGQTLKLGLAHALWMRMGRPYALDITVGRQLVTGLPADPANIVLTRDGVRG
jgi:helix-turn-helix protein/uncharacterized protein DUF4115